VFEKYSKEGESGQGVGKREENPKQTENQKKKQTNLGGEESGTQDAEFGKRGKKTRRIISHRHSLSEDTLRLKPLKRRQKEKKSLKKKGGRTYLTSRHGLPKASWKRERSRFGQTKLSMEGAYRNKKRRGKKESMEKTVVFTRGAATLSIEKPRNSP